jgi:hypothetical protein
MRLDDSVLVKAREDFFCDSRTYRAVYVSAWVATLIGEGAACHAMIFLPRNTVDGVNVRIRFMPAIKGGVGHPDQRDVN